MKRLLLLFLVVITVDTAPLYAAFLKDYDALKTTKLFDEPHYVGMADSITGKGGGLFLWIADDVRPEAWGLIFKSLNDDRRGSWVRQGIVRLNPDWFGAYNKQVANGGGVPTFKNLGYDEAVIRKRYQVYIPDISLNDTPDWAALQLACRFQERGWDAVAFNPLTYYVNRSVRLPETEQPNDSRFFIYEGNGAEVVQVNTDAFAFFYTMPQDQRTSQNTFTARRFTFRNLSIRGKAGAGAGSAGIAIGGTFHSLFEDIVLTAVDTGIILRHAMGTVIQRCNTVNCYSVSFFLGSGTGAWKGATSINSSSNQSRVIGCRTVSWTHQKACIVIQHSSECRVEDFTLDGGEKRRTDYGIIINTGGATTVKDGYVKGVHGESMVDSALVKFRGGGQALFEVSDLFVQYPSTLVELEVPQGYAQVNCSHFSYFPGDCDFANKGAGGAWQFTDVTNSKQEIKWKTGEGYSVPNKDRLTNRKKQ